MKIPVLVLCAAQIVLCEVPPPYPRKGFRPHQPLLLPLLSQVQSFVPPSQKFTNGRIINGGSPFRPTSLQQSYGPPSKLQSQPQSTYGPPSYQKPSSTYNVPSKIQSQPDVIYGLPGIAQNPIQSQPQTIYGPPSGSQKVPSQLYGAPQTTYGAPNYQNVPPQNFGGPQQMQSLPQAFRPLPSQNSPSQSYGPPKQSEAQTTYGPPNHQVVLPQNFGAPQQIQSLPQAFRPLRPQNSPSQSYGPPKQSEPQATYGPPNHQIVPSQNFGAPQQIQSLPQTFRPLPPQNSASQSYGPPKQSEPQTTYGAPNHQVAPSQNFGAPQQIQSLPQAFRPLPSQNTPSQSHGPPKQTAYSPPSSQIAQGNVQSPSHAFGVQNSQAVLSQLYGTPSKVQSLPQTTYGTPDLQVEPLQTPRQAFQNLPQTSYGVPVAPSQAYGAPSKVQSQPQATYGVPSGSNEAQSVSNITPAPQKSFAQTYGAPPRTPEIETLERLKNQQFSNVIPTSQHLPLKEPVNFGRFLQGLPLREAENFRTGLPSQQYLPVREAENFNQGYPRSLNQNLGYSRNLNQQYLPVKDAQNFKQGFERNTAIANSFQGDFGKIFPAQNTPRTHTTVDVQKVDVMSVIPLDNNYPDSRNSNYPQPGNPNINPTSEFGTETPKRYPEENQTVGQVDNEKRNVAPQNGGYEPPVATTTEKPVLKRPTKPKQIPTTAPPEVDTEQGNEEDDNEVPERDETPDDGQSNVAIATAVAGGGSRHFYLLQPDGRLQRVTLEKTQETGDAANEYTANYLFQNIQPEPNGVYAPLISLVNK